jgi:addiction module RelE/StbE family toxin
VILEWSLYAIDDRTAIFDYIEADSPDAAVMIDDRIEAAAEKLEQFAEMGRPGRVEGTRELVIPGTPYLAAYRIMGRTVSDIARTAWCAAMARRDAVSA